MWSMRNFPRCQWDVPASVVDVVVRNTTTFITTRYYFACRGDLCAHFRRCEYRLMSPHSMTTACPCDWSLFLNPDHPDTSLITHLPPLDHFFAFHFLLSKSISPLCPSNHFVFQGATFDVFLSSDRSCKERQSTFVGSSTKKRLYVIPVG